MNKFSRSELENCEHSSYDIFSLVIPEGLLEFPRCLKCGHIRHEGEWLSLVALTSALFYTGLRESARKCIEFMYSSKVTFGIQYPDHTEEYYLSRIPRIKSMLEMQEQRS